MHLYTTLDGIVVFSAMPFRCFIGLCEVRNERLY
nr:MAG TPA_asm: hypothetical protein [Caudoviricetes sp.]